ncbi:MAG: cytidylate kinase-like family protein, partial [Delftia sp.]|nr:cytidylate kinase-like family protein [Delftia sp.]
MSSDERRIQAAKHQLRLERDKARRYLEDVDEDFRKWVHTLYGVAWEDAGHYDVTINLEQLSIENAAAALTVMAQLPDFQSTPASSKAMLDLRLAAHCRLALALDQRTHSARFKVRADGDVVTVNYLPHDGKHAEAVAEVLSAVQGAATVRTTMATTNILWLEETFNPASENFHDVVEIAAKWNAAVELMALESGEESPDQGDAGPPALAPSRPPASG